MQVQVEAHSGAVISSGAGPYAFVSANGEVNLTTPTINQQLDQAIRFYNRTGPHPHLFS